MTPQELRASILQQAIQGKLVEQRSEEGTGEELFQQIQTEKQALIKAGKIKKEKPLPEITDDEIQFDIPETWKWVRLGSLIHIESGKGLTAAQMKPGSIPVYGGNGVTGYHNESLLHEETVVIGRVGFYCGSVHVTEKESWVTDNAFITTYPKSHIDRSFLVYILRHMNLGQNNNATAQPVVSGKKIYPLLFPVPPLEEQKRIVAKLEEIIPLIDRYEASWNKLEEFNKHFPGDMQKSILQLAIQGKLVEQRPEEGTGEELFQQIQAAFQEDDSKPKRRGKKAAVAVTTEQDPPFDIPETWKWVKLGQLGYTNIGLTYSPKDTCNDGVVVLRSSNIQNGKMDYEDIVRVSCDIPDNKMCHIGDILICARNGSKRLVGKAALIDQEGMSFGAFMAIFRSVCNPYILHVINSAYFRNTLLGDTGTTTINQITQDMLKNVMIPLPPLAEQKRIVAKLEEILPLCDRLK